MACSPCLRPFVAWTRAAWWRCALLSVARGGCPGAICASKSFGGCCMTRSPFPRAWVVAHPVGCVPLPRLVVCIIIGSALLRVRSLRLCRRASLRPPRFSLCRISGCCDPRLGRALSRGLWWPLQRWGPWMRPAVLRGGVGWMTLLAAQPHPLCLFPLLQGSLPSRGSGTSSGISAVWAWLPLRGAASRTFFSAGFLLMPLSPRDRRGFGVFAGPLPLDMLLLPLARLLRAVPSSYRFPVCLVPGFVWRGLRGVLAAGGPS